mmetsp:Transcript_23196/g.79779  ORF Transcript_23196/g.79779 Transcript_23196/m.79779 type:complete len:436 (+) Transcript_23196:1529-2836(+)
MPACPRTPPSGVTHLSVATSQILALKSSLAVTASLASCVTQTEETAFAWPESVATQMPVSRSQTLAVLSRLPVTRRVPSGVTQTDSTACVWCSSSVRTHSPVTRFQTLAVLSLLAVIAQPFSPPYAQTAVTRSVWPSSVWMHTPFARSQSFAVQSRLADSPRSLPAKQTDVTYSVWPSPTSSTLRVLDWGELLCSAALAWSTSRQISASLWALQSSELRLEKGASACQGWPGARGRFSAVSRIANSVSSSKRLSSSSRCSRGSPRGGAAAAFGCTAARLTYAPGQSPFTATPYSVRISSRTFIFSTPYSGRGTPWTFLKAAGSPDAKIEPESAASQSSSTWPARAWSCAGDAWQFLGLSDSFGAAAFGGGGAAARPAPASAATPGGFGETAFFFFGAPAFGCAAAAAARLTYAPGQSPPTTTPGSICSRTFIVTP